MKVLIIQQKMIGDVLTTSILFEVLKNAYPNSELHYAINSHTYPVVKGHPYIDEYVFITPKIEANKLKFISFLSVIKKQKYDLVIDVYSKLSSNLIALASGAKQRISYYKNYTSFIYTQTYKNKKTPQTTAGLAIENRLLLLEKLKLEINPLPKPKIHLTEQEKSVTANFLIKNGIDLNKSLCMISVLGSGTNKTYPFAYMAELIDHIVENTDTRILFNYIPKQQQEALEIYNLCKPSTQKNIFFNVYGKNLREFITITHFCNAVIGNEGGAINMAKALNVPTFTVFSPWVKKETWAMFENGKTNISVHLKDFKPELFTNKTTKDLKPAWQNLYDSFTPNLVKASLSKFLNINFTCSS